MGWANYHSHSNLCDGEEAPEAYAQEAIQQGLAYFGFSSHAPLPFANSWTLPRDQLSNYREEINRLKVAYANEITLFAGLEIDYIPGETSPVDSEFQALPLDYTLGAVHFAGYDGAGQHWSIDDTPEVFAEGLQTGYNNDIRKVVEYYYALVREMVENACPDVIAHLDLIKKNNPKGCYFSEDAPWYRTAVCETLETIAASPAILEVNTGGIVRKRTDSFYPSTWVLEECYRMDISLTLSSDAHNPAHITSDFSNAAQILQKIGYQHLYIFDGTGWHPRKFTETGLLGL